MPVKNTLFLYNDALNYKYLSLSVRCDSVVEINPTQLGIKDVRIC